MYIKVKKQTTQFKNRKCKWLKLRDFVSKLGTFLNISFPHKKKVKDIISKCFCSIWYCNHQRTNGTNSSFVGSIFKKSTHLNTYLVNYLQDIIPGQEFEMCSSTNFSASNIYHVIFKALSHTTKCINAGTLNIEVLVRSKCNKGRQSMSWSKFCINIWHLSLKNSVSCQFWRLWDLTTRN